ncbi:ribosome silencing factor [Dehalogenimonas sp. 4OHTPN]|uniref:Ribosomal silencing factor RsfS n=1 Tax=Dehalogenimonas sp. 4OHTPN TaxID=3166643 RepID=A0AAU8GBQ6_9CHLR
MTDHAGGTPLETIEIARRIADIASEKQGADIVVTDVRGLSPITDYQVVLSADNTRLARAILDEVSDKLKKESVRPLHTEGLGPDQDWLIVDYGPVMMHVFTPEKRALYDFDRLWPQAKTVLALQ